MRTDREGQKVSVVDPAYGEVLDFLYLEAALLDDDALEEWLELLDDGIDYRVPVRMTAGRGEGSGFAEHANYLHDDLASLTTRVRRVVQSPMAWAEVPPTRSRRFVTNVRVWSSGDDLAVESSVLLLRSRWDERTFEFVSARRADLLRLQPSGLRLLQRQVMLDQVVMESPNLSVFL